MKHLTFLLLFVSFCSFGQFKTAFFEDFNNNNNSWPIGDDEESTCSIHDGVYDIKYKHENTYYYFYYGVYTDPSKKFRITVEYKQIEGPTNYGYGLLWGGGPGLNFNLIQVCDEFYQISKVVDDNFNYLKSWTEDPIARVKGQTNKLCVQGDGKSVKYFVNEVEVFETSNYEFFGTRIGFYLEGGHRLEVDYLKVEIEDIPINLTKDKNVVVDKTRLSNKINSKYADVFPVISPDGNTLYYIQKDHPDAIGGEGKDDIVYSTKGSNGRWGYMQRMGSPLNCDDHNLVVGVGAGNNSLLLGNEYDDNGNVVAEGFSMSHREGDGWSNPENLEIEDYYNDDNEFTASISANQKIMLFGIEREDTYGQSDIYFSKHIRGNKWTRPKNLGSVINTMGDESSPFLAPDNKTLYFSSDGHPGYGSNDIFVSHRLDDSWTRWSEPENLGDQVNTPAYDHYFTIAASGDVAYVCSEENSLGESDIFELKLNESARPDPVLLLRGKVLDANTGKPISAQIKMFNQELNEEVGLTYSDPKTGAYEMIIPDTASYGLFADLDGYYPVQTTMDADVLESFSVIERDLELAPFSKGQKIQLNNIFFVRSRAVILPKSLPELEKLAEILNENKTLKISIEGHTDNTGNAKLNKQLSQERADKIREYLVKQGIDKGRLKAVGWGGEVPIADNTREETRKKNRRVEFLIL